MTIDEYVARSRAAQGLPPKITDSRVLARLASLLASTAAPGGDITSGRRTRKATSRKAA